MIRRITDLAVKDDTAELTLFDTWRFHAFFTTTPPKLAGTVLADHIHRRHAIIEDVNTYLKLPPFRTFPPGGSRQTLHG